MGRIWRNAPFLSVITATMIIYSLMLAWSAWRLGIHWAEPGTVPFTPQVQATPHEIHIHAIEVLGYFQKLNWLLFPIYWPILAMLIYFSWNLYIKGWRSLSENHVLYRDGMPVGDSRVLDPLLQRLAACRPWLIVPSVILGIVLTTIDAGCVLREYGVAMAICSAADTAPDFTVAFRLPNNFPKFQGNDKSALFTFIVAQYFMQGILIAIAFMVLFQLSLHSLAFLNFEKLEIPKRSSLSIRLNVRDEFGEFGLMDVNRAINLTYVFIAIGMLIPVLSVANKPPDGDIGKTLMSILLPLLLFAPAVIPICDRVLRRDKAASEVRATNQVELINSFSKQKLWPFDQTAFSYVGKFSLAFAIASWVYVVTGELKNLFKAVGG